MSVSESHSGQISAGKVDLRTASPPSFNSSHRANRLARSFFISGLAAVRRVDERALLRLEVEGCAGCCSHSQPVVTTGTIGTPQLRLGRMSLVQKPSGKVAAYSSIPGKALLLASWWSARSSALDKG